MVFLLCYVHVWVGLSNCLFCNVFLIIIVPDEMVWFIKGLHLEQSCGDVIFYTCYMWQLCQAWIWSSSVVLLLLLLLLYMQHTNKGVVTHKYRKEKKRREMIVLSGGDCSNKKFI